jgi:adenylate cyclase
MERIDRALLIDPDNLNMRYNFACALAAANDTAGAIRMLGPVLQRSSRVVLKLAESDPDFDSLRDDPRFQKIVADARKRLGITDPPEPAVQSAAAT